MTEVRIAVIGCGPMGRIHARNASRARACRLTAVADVDTALARAVADETRPARTYSHEQAVLDDPEVDAVIIATPPETHAELIAAAARAGKHILCEKPVGVGLAETDSALRAVEAAAVKLMIGFNRRFDPDFHRISDSIAAGEIGDIHTIHIISRDPAQFAAPPRGARDLFLDTTIHDFDMVRFLSAAEPVSVHSVGGRLGDGRGDPDTAVTLLGLETGAIAVIDNSRLSAHGYDQRIEAFGSAGLLAAPNVLASSVTLHTAAGSRGAAPLPFFAERYSASYAAELDAFLACLRDDSVPPVTGEDGRAALLLALAAQRSYREGRSVEISELSG